MSFDIMDWLNNKTINKIGKWMDKNNMFYVPAKLGWKLISYIVGGFNNKAHDIYMIGQSHLDACWVWDWKSTVMKNHNTFSHALEHLEDYPFYTFSCSSPQYYYWMERYYPAKFEKIKEWVDKGRIELVGGMWIEPDLNLVSGESLARQRLYGQRYYLEKFGKISKIGWLSDTFGYCWTLPQILKKSGSDYFFTNKMQWNDTNKWPFVLFYWMGPDGSKVMTYTYSYTVNLLFQDPNLGDFTKMSAFFESPDIFSYKDEFREIKKLKTKEPLREFGFVYGIGDGGGGPVRSEVIFFKELSRDRIVKNFITMGQYFKLLEKYKDRIPAWNDEMYLEQHRGCYTSHSWLKVANRNAEQLLYKTEILLTLSSKFGLKYPRKKFENLYKRLLFNQFHDILPGSSIPKVYEDTKHDFEVINKGCEDLIDLSFKTILDKLDTKGNVILFNPLNWGRSDIIKLTRPKNFLIKDMNANYLPFQKIGDDKYIFVSPEIPPIGFLELIIEDTEEIKKFNSNLEITDENNEILLENKFIKLIINKESGNIRSIYHKKLKKEILSGEGNEIQVFKEKFGLVGFTAWNIDKNYKKRPIETSLDSVSIVEQGPVRIVALVKKWVNKSKINQLIILYNDIDRIDFKIDLEFYEKWSFVKLAFPLNVETDKVNCEIPYGVISRATKEENSNYKAQFEIPVQRWLDISQKDFGVTMVNKTRYGFDVKYDKKLKNIARMTILRIPKYPTEGSPLTSIIPSKKFHDQVYFSVDYSLIIHEKDWINAKSHRKGIEFNIPTIFKNIENKAGDIKLPIEFLSVEPHNVVLSAVKLCEDDDSLVIRVYETTGSNVKCSIKLNDIFKIKNVEEVDLLELNPKKLENFTENELTLEIKKFEIKILKIEVE